MANDEVLRFDVIGQDHASEAFSRAGESAKGMGVKMDKATRDALGLDEALRRQHSAARASTDATLALAKSDEILAEVERRLRDGALEAEWALKKEAAAKRESALAGRGAGLEGIGGGLGGGGGLPSLGPVPFAALIPILPAIGAAAVELTGLVSGFAAAGAGAAAFGLLALPAFKKVSGALSQIKADQQAYDRALTTTAKNSALKHLQADYKSLDPAQRAAVTGIQQLGAEFGKISKAFEPAAFKVFADVLGIANKLLPTVVPFANTFASALDGLLKQVSKFAGSKGFADWLKQFHTLEGPAITAIGEGIGKVAVAAGKLLTTLNAADVVKSIGILFNTLAAVITGFTWTVARLAHNWTEMISGFKHTIYDIKRWSDGFTQAFDAVRHGAATLAHDVAHWFDVVRHDVAAAWNATWSNTVGRAARGVSDVLRWIGTLPGRIIGLFRGAGSWLYGVGQSIVSGLVNGIKSLASSVWSAIAGLIPGGGIASNVLHGLGFASGTSSAPPGWAWVGERGPELMRFHGGEQVMPAGASAAAAREHRGGGDVYNITVNVPPTVNPKEAGRQVAEIILAHTRGGGRLYPAGVTPR